MTFKPGECMFMSKGEKNWSQKYLRKRSSSLVASSTITTKHQDSTKHFLQRKTGTYLSNYSSTLVSIPLCTLAFQLQEDINSLSSRSSQPHTQTSTLSHHVWHRDQQYCRRCRDCCWLWWYAPERRRIPCCLLAEHHWWFYLCKDLPPNTRAFYHQKFPHHRPQFEVIPPNQFTPHFTKFPSLSTANMSISSLTCSDRLVISSSNITHSKHLRINAQHILSLNEADFPRSIPLRLLPPRAMPTSAPSPTALPSWRRSTIFHSDLPLVAPRRASPLQRRPRTLSVLLSPPLPLLLPSSESLSQRLLLARRRVLPLRRPQPRARRQRRSRRMRTWRTRMSSPSWAPRRMIRRMRVSSARRTPMRRLKFTYLIADG